jgi:hypothetical protein
MSNFAPYQPLPKTKRRDKNGNPMYTGKEAQEFFRWGDHYNMDLYRLEPSDDVEGCFVLRPEGITSAKVAAFVISLLIAATFLLLGAMAATQ